MVSLKTEIILEAQMMYKPKPHHRFFFFSPLIGYYKI